MSPAQDSNKQALKILNQKIAGMKKVFAELQHVSGSTPDLQLQGSLRVELTELNEEITFFEAQRDALAATQEIVTAPSPEQIQDVQDGLRDLDEFVRLDQDAHATVTFLRQVLAQLKG